MARFDNSAIYRTIDPRNQLDINKLYGFSEGLDHQFNSARFGWRFSNDSVRLFAYVYANGKRSVAEICTVPLNEPIQCSIKVFPTAYLLSAGNNQVQMERGVASPIAKGFLQYPYFGGNETAPHDVYISIGTFSK
ncbi:MAG TPA: hypothetical protein PKD90_18320 [Phnomibacter sp.]|nr:hypothetical protein [Phnomibacter sp.]